MRQLIAIVSSLGLILLLAFSAGAQVDPAKLKKKAADKQSEDSKDLKDKATSKRNGIEEDDDDDGGHAGAIVGGVAAAAIVGTVVAKTKGGGGDKGKETVSFGTMDGNKDGKLSREEFTSAMSKGFKASDNDGDGVLTRAEAVAAYGDMGGKYFDALDGEKTGSISMDALQKDASEAFHWADADGDGSITGSEKTRATAENTAAETEQKTNPGNKAKKLLRKVT